MKDLFKTINNTGNRIFYDGAMGTMLQEAGLPAGAVPEYWNIERPDLLSDIHRQFIAAGSDIITTNTFGLSTIKLPDPKYSVAEMASAAVDNARCGIRLALADGGSTSRTDSPITPKIAFSLGPCGRLLAPSGDADFEDVVASYGPAVRAAEKAGADFIQIETIADLYELKAVILAVKENSDLPFAASVTLDENGRLLTGADLTAVTALAESMGASALGINCGFGPSVIEHFVPSLLEYASVPVVVYPNAGLPSEKNGHVIYDLDPDAFAGEMRSLAGTGVQMLGGCCGTTPEHIKKMIEKCGSVPAAGVTEKKRTLVCSYTHSVEIGHESVIIGEKINPTGNKSVAASLRQKSLSAICELGLSETAAGAHINDLNVGLPDIDETAMLAETMKELQTVSDAPLVIDTSKPEAMEKALRRYNGKAVINSVNGKDSSLSSILPLVKKYGGVIIGLALDAGGIPDTAEGRTAVAEKIISRAASFGIPRKDVIIDPLTLTVSVDRSAAEVTLASLKMIKEKLGVATVLGVSNISFGLPGRNRINKAFYAWALSCGLDAGIIDPFSEDMMEAYRLICGAPAADEKKYLSGHAPNEDECGGGHVPTDDECGGGHVPAEDGCRAEFACVLDDAFAAAEGKADAAAEGKTNDARHAGTDGGSGISADRKDSRSTSAPGLTLQSAIVSGLKERAGELSGALLVELPPQEVIDRHIIPALDTIGERYEKKQAYLPQLLASAEAANAAFDKVKEAISRQAPAPGSAAAGHAGNGSGTESASPDGSIVLATVYGDIHDIGKNIVKVLLESNGFDVIDLGRDVPPEKIVAAAADPSVKIVGLSALMTTTVPYMETTIKLLKDAGLGCLTVVGGAVLNKEYASRIGADIYAHDATDTVKFAKKIIAD